MAKVLCIMLYHSIVLLLVMFSHTKGTTITAIQGSSKVIEWKTSSIPSSEPLTIYHEVKGPLFVATGSVHYPLYYYPGMKVTDAYKTNQTTGRIYFVLYDITVNDAGNYRAKYATWHSTVGVTLVVYVKPSKSIITTDGVTLVVRDTLTLNCSAISNTKPDNHNLHMMYRWYRNTKQEASGRQLQIKLQKSDDGADFTCRAYETSSLLSDVSDRYTAYVKYGPDGIVLQPSSPQHVLLENATLEPVSCEADCNPLCRYRWIRNGEVIDQTDVLKIENVRHDKSGVYTCVASNLFGAYSKNVSIVVLDAIVPMIQLQAECKSAGMAELLIHAQTNVDSNIKIQVSTDELEFQTFNSTFDYQWQQLIRAKVYGLKADTKYFFKVISTVYESSNQLSCTTPGEGTLLGENKLIYWTMDPKPSSSAIVTVLHPSEYVLFTALASHVISVNNELGRRVINTGNTNTSKGYIEFTLTGITFEDAGGYRATYASSGFSSKRVGKTLVITEKPSRPTCTNINHQTLVVGNTLTLKCSSNSNSKPDYYNLQMLYRWNKNGLDLPDDERYNASGQYLHVKNIQKTDNGAVFACKSFEIKSLLSDVSNGYIVHANYAPGNLVLQPSSTQQILIANATLGPINCNADCNPPCQYQWMRNGEKITQSNVLKIENVQIHQSGVYSCLSWNKQGAYSSDLLIIVLETVQPPIQLRAECRSSGMAELLIQVQEYVNASLDVQASSDGGESQIVTFTLDYSGQHLIVAKVYGLKAKTSYTFEVYSNSRFGIMKSQNNLNCTTHANAMPESPQINDGNMMLNAGIAMIVVAFVVILVSTIITVVILRRNLCNKEHGSNSVHYEDVGSNHRQDTSQQNGQNQEMKYIPEIYEDLGRRDAPTIYEDLTTQGEKQDQYANTGEL